MLIREQLFPGLIYRMLKPKVVLLIFVSGKIVLTGAKVKACSFFLPPGGVFVSPSARTFADLLIGPRRDLHSIQHNLHGVVRVQETVTSP